MLCCFLTAGSDFDPAPIVDVFTPSNDATTLLGCIGIIDDNLCEPEEQFCLEGGTSRSRVHFTVLNNVTVTDNGGECNKSEWVGVGYSDGGTGSVFVP